MERNEAIIRVTGLKKSFKQLEVLRGITLEIAAGEVVVIIGPSGSGKSTFLRCLNRLEESTAGRIVIDGADITDRKTDINKVRERVGMVFQHFNLFNNMNVLRNLMIAPTDLKKADRETVRRDALNMLNRVGLSDKAEVYPHQLSGGQKQRV
ncbi:MAG: amino acid ABC transporter ATP-binding protein, partial [Clostridia bacterium]|nr:amino acid ABC transporter ATP-binding protein [Clostridia bacterium]